MTDFPVDDFDESQSYPGLVPGHVAPTNAHPLNRLGEVSPLPSPADALTQVAPFRPQNVSQAPRSYHPEPPKESATVTTPPQKVLSQAQPTALPPMPPVQRQMPPAQPQRPPMPPQHHRGHQGPPGPPMPPPVPQMPPVGFQHHFNPQQVPANPLAGYFRLPGLNIGLPTDGIYMPPGSIEFDMSGQVQVYPMRAADELLLKSPDALMSGFAVEALIASCVPAIKFPRMVSSPDLDVILLAIRAASYGNDMTVEVTCPKCQGESEITVDLRSILSRSSLAMPSNVVELSSELTIYLRPYDLNNATQVSLATFHETRAVQAAEAQGQENAQRQMNESYKRMTELDIAMTADCVLQIVIPDATVTDKQHIREFMENIPCEWTNQINERLKAMNAAGLDKTTQAGCAHCHHEWESKAEFDPSSFFGQNS